MKEAYRKFKISVIEKAIYDILKYLFIFIFSSGVAGTVFHSIISHIKFINQYALILSISLAAGIGLLFVIIIKPQNIYNYRIIEKEYEYKYKSKREITLKKKFRIKAITKTCNLVYDRFNWTGSGKATVSCSDPAYEIFKLTRNDNFQRIEIRLNRYLKRGEIINFELIYTLEDPLETAVPFLCTTVVEPTKIQILRVIIPEEYKIKKANIHVRRSSEDHVPNTSDQKEFKNGVYEWSVNKPKLHNEYSISWSMNNVKEEKEIFN